MDSIVGTKDRKIIIFDTTLRDGEQAPGCAMNIEEKLEVARQLELLGVDIIEAGFAISSPGDSDSVKAVAKEIKNCTVASLARAVEKDIDAAYEAVKYAESPLIHTFIATSPIHMKYKLRMTPEEVLEHTYNAVSYAVKRCPNVEFSAEDAMRSDREFLAKVVGTAIKAGAKTVNIPDTVGYVTPQEMSDMITYLKSTVPGIDQAVISVHCHNDLGMAVANSIAGIRAGAGQVECTINGLGERAGNAALEEIVMAIKTRREFLGCYTGIDTKQINRASKLVYGIIGQTPCINKPIVGANAFAHEAGIHQHGVLAERTTYEIMSPEDVGISKNKLVLGKHSGKHAIEDRLRELGYKLSAEKLTNVYDKFKELCDKKKTIVDSDLEALVHDREYVKSHYRLEHFDVHTSKSNFSTCVIRLKKGEEMFEEVSLGDGPINAAYNAIDKITGTLCDELSNYSIHSVSQGKDALGEVTVKLRSGERTVIGRGLSTDIIESSILAYVNGINKLIDR
ncbi:MAG: 2-isopropylmalate synthase [Clostridiales bacterium]|jgi:2-isopropylmalate synthase|nr:2-isopropylmalate synthase [Clostridiales bacterium]